MTELTDAEIDAALERGRMAQQTEPRADAVRYDRRNSRIIVDLTNGCTFAFPPALPKVWKRPARTSWRRSRSWARATAYTGRPWTWTSPFPA